MCPREGQAVVDQGIVDAARARGEDPLGDIAEKIPGIIQVQPAREMRRQRLAVGEGLQGIDLVEERGLRSDGHQQLDLGQLALGEQVDAGDAAQAVGQEHDRAVLGEAVADPLANRPAVALVDQDVADGRDDQVPRVAPLRLRT